MALLPILFKSNGASFFHGQKIVIRAYSLNGNLLVSNVTGFTDQMYLKLGLQCNKLTQDDILTIESNLPYKFFLFLQRF